MRNPIIAALDVPTADQAVLLAEAIAPAVGGFKIGMELFTAAGPEVVRRIRGTGASVFLDLSPDRGRGSLARGSAGRSGPCGAWPRR